VVIVNSFMLLKETTS